MNEPRTTARSCSSRPGSGPGFIHLSSSRTRTRIAERTLRPPCHCSPCRTPDYPYSEALVPVPHPARSTLHKRIRPAAPPGNTLTGPGTVVTYGSVGPPPRQTGAVRRDRGREHPMANPNDSDLPSPSAEHRRVAAGQFEHANQVIATRKNYDYGIVLLLKCCLLDPGNLIYRQALRRTQRARYQNNLRGSPLAWLTTWPIKARLTAARRGKDYLKALEYGERILVRNPLDVPTQMAMAEAMDPLGLLDIAIWCLEQARHKKDDDVTVNRALAQLLEKRGNFTQAMALWAQVGKVKPTDEEAAQKR